MRSRLAIFSSTTVLALAGAAGTAVAHYSDCDPEPSVITYEIDKAKETTTYYLFFFKKTTTQTVEQQCKAALAEASRTTEVTLKWGPDRAYCWVTKTVKNK